MIDLNKPLRTKQDRLAVRVLATDVLLEGKSSLVVAIKTSEWQEAILQLTLDGRYFTNGNSSAWDLENIPEPKVGFVNVYEDTRGVDVGCTYRTLAEAQNVPGRTRGACKGLLKLTLTEGKLEVEVLGS